MNHKKNEDINSSLPCLQQKNTEKEVETIQKKPIQQKSRQQREDEEKKANADQVDKTSDSDKDKNTETGKKTSTSKNNDCAKKLLLISKIIGKCKRHIGDSCQSGTRFLQHPDNGLALSGQRS